MHNRSASKHSVCLAERYNNLSLERAREKYAADIHGLLTSLNQGLIALAFMRVESGSWHYHIKIAQVLPSITYANPTVLQAEPELAPNT